MCFQVLSGAFRCFALSGGRQTSPYPTTSEPPPLFHQVHSALPSFFGGLEVGSSFANNMVIFRKEKEGKSMQNGGFSKEKLNFDYHQALYGAAQSHW